MIFLYYIIIGLIVALLRSIICVVKCSKIGINLNILNKFISNYLVFNIWSILIGIIIWPIRLILFNNIEKDIIDSCLHYKTELEKIEESEK